MVNLSGNHPVLLFCTRTGNALSSAMAQGALAIAAMAHPDLCSYYTALLQRAHHVLNNLCNASSLPSPVMKITEPMEVMLKMPMHLAFSTARDSNFCIH